MTLIKDAARAMTPNALILARRRWLLRRTEARFGNSSNAEIFSSVYAERNWGQTEAGGFSSGDGSHDPAIYKPYVDAVREFLGSFPTPPSVVDLGCGDFNVGRQIRSACAEYVACDVVQAVIDENSRNPDFKDVEFKCIDITKDELPPAQVVTIRQVLQHLSNADIALVLPKLEAYTHLIFTDHQPRPPFEPNLDIPSGPHTRVGIGAALDLAQPPFGLTFVESRELCVVPDGKTVIRTTLYKLR